MTDEQKFQQQLEKIQRLQSYLQQDPDNTNLIGDIFDLALSVRSFELAQDMVNRSLFIDNSDPGWQNRYAILLIAQKKLVEAKQVLLRLAEQGFMKSGVQFNLAYIAFCEQQFEQAFSLSQELLDDPVVSADALYLQLRCLHSLRRYEEALALISQYENTAASSANSIGAASLIAVDHSQLKVALRYARQALMQNPDQVEALVAMATLSLGNKNDNEALELLQKAMLIKPDDGRTESAMGLAYMLRKDVLRAIHYLESAVQHMPGHIGTWLALGWCYFSSEELKKARNTFQQALLLDRNFAESHGALAVCLIKDGENQSAAEHIERALRLDQNCVSAIYARSLLSGNASDQEKLLIVAERILRGK